LVIRHLQAFSPVRILIDDLIAEDAFANEMGCTWTDKETIFREAHIISLHVPLTRQTRHMIQQRELEIMKPDAILINTSRGGIIDEAALAATLRASPDFSAAIDVFEDEPYSGELSSLDNCLLSCHMGSCTNDCRRQMEIEAAREVIRYYRGEPFATPVPEAEYVLQKDL
jgi:D-3-phosphoglycerate dehydrogenase